MSERTNRIVSLLKETYKEPQTELKYKTPFQLLVSVILSAQTTDKTVNKVTPGLFKKYGTPEKLSKAKITAVEKLIYSVNFYKTKTRNIIATAYHLLEKHKGKIPKTLAELVEFPGVSRKTANVVLSQLYGINEGVVVDTHVMRLSQRLGLTNHKDPKKIEQDLMAVVPKSYWGDFSMALILHGRSVCKARRPACDKCVLSSACPSAFNFPHFKK